MSSFKKLNPSEVFTSKNTFNKQWDLVYCSYPNDQYVQVYKGTKYTGSFTSNSEYITNGRYDRLVYEHINYLFYQKYDSNLDNTSLIDSVYFESSSIYRPVDPYVHHYEGYKIIDNFPTGSNDGIRVLNISPKLYGNRIIPGEFQLQSSSYNITDDGECNLNDNNEHVGNIFYSHGIVVITNPQYQTMFPIPYVARSGNFEFNEGDTKNINILDLVDRRLGDFVHDSFTYILPLLLA